MKNRDLGPVTDIRTEPGQTVMSKQRGGKTLIITDGESSSTRIRICSVQEAGSVLLLVVPSLFGFLLSTLGSAFCVCCSDISNGPNMGRVLWFGSWILTRFGSVLRTGS